MDARLLGTLLPDRGEQGRVDEARRDGPRDADLMATDDKPSRIDAFDYVTGAIITAGTSVGVAAGLQLPAEVQGGLSVIIPTLSLAAAHGLHRVLVPRRDKF